MPKNKLEALEGFDQTPLFCATKTRRWISKVRWTHQLVHHEFNIPSENLTCLDYQGHWSLNSDTEKIFCFLFLVHFWVLCSNTAHQLSTLVGFREGNMPTKPYRTVLPRPTSRVPFENDDFAQVAVISWSHPRHDLLLCTYLYKARTVHWLTHSLE